MPMLSTPTQETAVPAKGPRIDAGGENAHNPFRPIIIGKGTPQLFEPKYVATAKYVTPPFTPDTIIDGWENDFLTLRGASVRGGSHRWENTPRQDSFAAAFVPDKNWVVVAVADGVSGAPQSHIGASVAVNSTVSYLVNIKTSEIGCIDWKHVCKTIARDLKSVCGSMRGYEHMLGTIGETENDIAAAALRYLATTLVCAVITKHPGENGMIAQVITVGDSGVWLLSGARFHAVAGGKDDSSGITSNDVAPLPYVPDVIEPIEIPVKPGEVLLFGTDGFGEPLGSGDGDLGRLFRAALETIPSPLSFANALDFTRKYFVDDRTLVAIWPREDARDK
jgi:hypothetical protein